MNQARETLARDARREAARRAPPREGEKFGADEMRFYRDLISGAVAGASTPIVSAPEKASRHSQFRATTTTAAASSSGRAAGAAPTKGGAAARARAAAAACCDEDDDDSWLASDDEQSVAWASTEREPLEDPCELVIEADSGWRSLSPESL